MNHRRVLLHRCCFCSAYYHKAFGKKQFYNEEQQMLAETTAA